MTPIGASAPGSSEQELGHEVDAWTSWRPWPVLSLTGGYSLFVSEAGARAAIMSVPIDATYRETRVAAVSHFAYLQATLRVP